MIKLVLKFNSNTYLTCLIIHTHNIYTYHWNISRDSPDYKKYVLGKNWASAKHEITAGFYYNINIYMEMVFIKIGFAFLLNRCMLETSSFNLTCQASL